VSTLAERDAIPANARVRRVQRVYVQETNRTYDLKNGTENADWEEVAEVVQEDLNAIATLAGSVQTVQNGLTATNQTMSGMQDDLDDLSVYVDASKRGIVGDGIVDDTAALIALLAQSNHIYFPRNAVLRLTSQVIVENKTIDLNGSTLQFYTTSAARGLWMKSNSKIRNGTVRNNVTDVTPLTSGEYGCGILIGTYLNNIETENVVVENMTVDSTRTNGNPMVILGRTHDVKINNIKFPNNAVTSRAITVHWGFVNSGTAAGGTNHPHNIQISNIAVGDYSSNLTEAGIITLSACYNVSVENVNIKSCNIGLHVYAGDYGFDFAEAGVKSLAFSGLSVKNFFANGVRYRGGQFVGNAYLGSGTQSIPVVVNNANFTADINSAFSRGIHFGSIRDCVLENCKTSKFYYAYIDAGTTERITLRNCIASEATHWGFYLIGVFASSIRYYGKHWVLDNCKALNSNTSNTAGRAAFYFESQTNITVRNCYVDSPLVATAFRFNTASDNTGASLLNNYVKSCLTTAFSIGSVGDVSILANCQGNRWEPGITNGFGGSSPLVVETTARGTRIARVNGTSSPTSGTWVAGDKVYFNTPSAGGYEGAICTIGGEPGTWKTFGLITA
jgi:hypothetical protein